MKTVRKYNRIKLKARLVWSDEETNISPIFFPLSCEWMDNNSCSIFARNITDFKITKRVKSVVMLFEIWWIISVKWHRFIRYQLPHRIYLKYLKHTYINNNLPF